MINHLTIYRKRIPNSHYNNKTGKEARNSEIVIPKWPSVVLGKKSDDPAINQVINCIYVSIRM